MEFAIPDMTCQGCANAITRAVNRLDPAATLDVDIAVKTVKIASMLPEQRLIEVIEAAGFHPSAGN
ncbi:heavy-metal-associated domain-containing protein [Paraburkholderia sp. RL18-103-BIB-C]|jgi:copper chaperone|uniref:heavy-metal-associated domain-containing protein n=1 Tax=unclassified Paraburkholderia TaxID=2615204 RepID=UPI002F526765